MCNSRQLIYKEWIQLRYPSYILRTWRVTLFAFWYIPLCGFLKCKLPKPRLLWLYNLGTASSLNSFHKQGKITYLFYHKLIHVLWTHLIQPSSPLLVSGWLNIRWKVRDFKGNLFSYLNSASQVVTVCII